MLPGHPGNTSRERNKTRGIIRSVHSVLAVCFLQRNLVQNLRPGRGINISGVDFWHAVEFSRNGRFLRNRFTGSSGRFPSVFRVSNLTRSVFRSVSGPNSVSGGRWRAFAFRLSRLYQSFSESISTSLGGPLEAVEDSGFPRWRSRKRTGAG